MYLNPLTYFAERVRELMLHGGGFELSDSWVFLGGITMLTIGRWFFNRLAPSFEDFL
jgi:ABC-type polysaccharide/polyol phosphate export permease